MELPSRDRVGLSCSCACSLAPALDNWTVGDHRVVLLSPRSQLLGCALGFSGGRGYKEVSQRLSRGLLSPPVAGQGPIPWQRAAVRACWENDGGPSSHPPPCPWDQRERPRPHWWKRSVLLGGAGGLSSWAGPWDRAGGPCRGEGMAWRLGVCQMWLWTAHRLPGAVSRAWPFNCQCTSCRF